MIAFDHEGISDAGAYRDQNEDYLTAHVPDDPNVRQRKGCMWVVADGVSGHRAGEVAARLAAQTLVQSYFASRKKPLAALRTAFQDANLKVCDQGLSDPACHRMETTLTALVLVGTQAITGHVGDTRVYRIRQEQVTQLTQDHSEVAELVRMQILTVTEAQRHPRRHVITRSIGSELMTQGDFRVETVEGGDAFVLCSDGLWEVLDASDLVHATGQGAAGEAVERLAALALERGSTDNVSLHVVKIHQVPPAPPAADGSGFLKRAFSRLWAGQS